MKRGILTTLLFLFSVHAYSQGLYGIEAGLDKATISKSKVAPAFEGYYMKRFTRSIYMGASLSFQRYSFVYTDKSLTPGNVQFGDVLSIAQKCSYLFLTPKFDLGIGYRKYWHASVAFGPGILLGGQQYTDKYEPFWTAPAPYGKDTTTFITGNSIPVIRAQWRLGISRRITTFGFWNIMVSADYTYIPGNISTGKPNLQTNAFCFTIGAMHKYPQVFVEY
jgi:hypothetical protein